MPNSPTHRAVRMLKQHKYGVVPKEQRRHNGRVYASKAEASYAALLWFAFDNGEIVDLIEQPRKWLGHRDNVYVPDFLVVWADGTIEYIDVKGMETLKFKKAVNLWKKYGRLPLRIVKASGGGFVTDRVIEGGEQAK